jgi:CRISPR-associated endonuclease/helicase Cas3
MPSIVPFAECLARPTESGKIFLLSAHLLHVKAFMEKRLAGGDACLIRLAGLAGLCHDMAKAHPEWQQYIRKKRNRGPHHAPEGAFLFSYLAYQLLQGQQKWQPYKLYWLWLTRDMADHHGVLKEMNDNHWIGSEQWQRMDLPGIANFIGQHYPELQSVDISAESLDKWAETVFDVFEEAEESIDLGYHAVNTLEIMKKLQTWREITTTLIAGDRFDVGSVAPSWFDKESHRENMQALDRFCATSQGALSRIRFDAQRQIMEQLAAHPRQRMYTLEMPTGYGKTITALKMAAWLGLTQGCRKIVYVAPYLSILEQNSGVFEESMGRRAMEHHSLAFLDSGNGSGEEDGLTSNQLSMESWANAIVCTSFQQWFKALFPGRAQDTLRRAFLKDSVVIIDEPQIISPESWNVFLCGLEAVAEHYNLRVIFLSATMPPFHYGLSQEPVCLAVRTAEQIERYRVVRCGEMDEKQLAEFLLTRAEQTQAAILNTIADAYQVYHELKDRQMNLKLLHGMMTPLHKRVEIAKIKDGLKRCPGEPICVISTQIIEAGVDLSFQHVARALPVLPAAVQAAGRVNRHFEGIQQGILSLFSFLRGGKKNTRNAIYNTTLQKITDALLEQKKVWQESEMLQLIKDYYQKMFECSTFEAGKQAIGEAYEGNWPELAKFQPFESDYFKLPVFVPWQPAGDDALWLPPKFVELQKKLNLYSAEEVYQQYEDREYLARLPLEKRKEFMILFNHYVINVPFKLATLLVDKELYLKNRIPALGNTGDYDPVTGLARRHVEGYERFI